jgi:hypothetical protein
MILVISSVNIVLADSNWECSIEDANLSGNLDNILHYFDYDSSQVVSKVSMPQNQDMIILSGKYNFADGKFIKLQYGSTDINTKGRGSDSDWTTPGSNVLTYYGNMDSYGYQRMYTVDLGIPFYQMNKQKVTIVAGWQRQESTNEFKNVIYHLVDGDDVGNQTQADDGSRLNAFFSGPYIGVLDDIAFSDKFTFDLGLNIALINAEVYGYWNNHNPANDWVSNGSGLVYTANIGFQYAFNNHLTGRLGYYYNYLEVDGCDDILNGEDIYQAVDFRYEISGFNFTLNYKF